MPGAKPLLYKFLPTIKRLIFSKSYNTTNANFLDYFAFLYYFIVHNSLKSQQKNITKQIT